MSVACSRCAAQVPVSSTTFSELGEYLCHRCTSVKSLHQSVAAARENAIAEANSRGGWGIGGMIARWLAVRQAKREHEVFVRSLPDVEHAPSFCIACKAPVPRGYQMCDRCTAAAK